jgi:hypothetical protein
MTLPLSLLLLDAYPLRRWAQGLRAVVMEKASYLVLAAIGAAVAVFARGHGANWTSYTEHGLLARVALAAYSLAFYPLKLVWPRGCRRSSSCRGTSAHWSHASSRPGWR